MEEHKENIQNTDVNLKMTDTREKVGAGSELASCCSSPQKHTQHSNGASALFSG